MSEQLSVADVLERAADLIEPEGRWVQGMAYADAAGLHAMEDSAKCMCVLGAMWRVGEETDGPATLFLDDYLGQWPADWNDEKGRTQTEVVAKLREAAAKAREQGA